MIKTGFMLNALALSVFSFALAAPTQAQPTQTYHIVGASSSTVANNVTKTVTTVQVGSNPLNRFLMTRVRKDIPDHALKGTVLLLPPLASGFQNYEVGDGGDYKRSFAGFLTRRNYDVWGYSQRTQGLAAGSCESGVVDCSVMADWGLQTILDDVAFIRQQIEAAHPGEKPVVGGLSLGSIASLATINAHPNEYAGAILIDGTIYDEDPFVRNINANFCSVFNDLLAGGAYYDGQGTPGAKLISHLAQMDPTGLSPIPGFPPGFTNHQAFVAALSSPQVSPVTPRPGFYQLAGSIAEDRFFFANESLVHDNISGFVDYVANRTVRDINCGLAGEQTFTANLHNFTGPVLIFAAGNGFGSGMIDTANLMTSATVTLNFRGDYGHVDYVFSNDHLHELERPVLKWLKKL
ncbi:MAG: alpha/beta hydrolase [Pyrinomonadaceae bacterium]